ncbi:hypothetical protein K503DRAFT_301447 [Rhizopogon vinicolor AM-OR11-026]|uniref:NACHT domain-containing protein n=1 Tax=Rhizopogon vinicolor AM-OR11-026 TaxID=1314800 RepID=A0A1B7MV10_9AGAM|nr:hypothetical protein K503DRAFT_301447 [Rhizopogon vinicolor AM-OR11-026]
MITFSMSDWDQAAWQKLSEVAVKGAQYNSPQRQPHPKCLEGTRVNLLNHIYTFLDNPEKNQLIWLHGTAGVGKSAVAFTVAERMKGLKVREETIEEKRLAGTFFFSRKYANRCTTGKLFATLVYQLASNFPSIKDEVTKAIRENPAILDLDTSLEDQMEALFLQPLRGLQLRLRECPPLVFVVDALDECTSEAEIVDLISLLGQALRHPGLPVTHILLTSRSEPHIRNAFQRDEVHPLVCEIPVEISGSESVATIISLDGADVDNDICIFLQHSFKELHSRCPTFPQPKQDELARLANRAGRRFIVASTMMKFIDDGFNVDPRDRLQLMLELTNKLLPGTEVYKLYDLILSTCADPKRAYRHLSVIVTLVDPLPMSQISELLGPGEGRDVETVLLQLRSVMDIPTDSSLPVNIYHSSVRDYASDPSNCSLSDVQCITPPHSLLAYSSFRLMIEHLPEGTALLDALSELGSQSQAAQSHDPQRLKHTLDFIDRRPEPLQVLIGLLWLRGNRDSESHFWLESWDGWMWLQTKGGKHWVQTQGGQDWVQTEGGKYWLQISEQDCVQDWEQQGGQDWLQAQGGQDELQTQGGQDWLGTQRGQDWLQTQEGKDWLQTWSGKYWLGTQGGQDWLETLRGQFWLETWRGQDWRGTQGGQDWLLTQRGQDWLLIRGGHVMQTQGEDGLQTQGGARLAGGDPGRAILAANPGRARLAADPGRESLAADPGRASLATDPGRARLAADKGCMGLAAIQYYLARLVANILWSSMAVNTCRIFLADNGRILQHTGRNQQGHGCPRGVPTSNSSSYSNLQRLTGFLVISSILGIEIPGPSKLCTTTAVFSTKCGDHPCYEGLHKFCEGCTGTKSMCF